MSDSRVRPDWFSAGLISATLGEPPHVQKYRGAQPQSVESQYEEHISDTALDSLRDQGVNVVYFRFFAGFGMEYEKTAMEQARALVQRIHSRNMKAAALISLGAVTLETLLLEEPDAHNWLQYNTDGKHVAVAAAAATQNTSETSVQAPSVRVRPCYNSENYLRSMERVCSLALDFGADLIHFDELGYNPEPDTCRCPSCIAAFREFLRGQYGLNDENARAAGHERFGHNSFTHVRPPAIEGSFNGPHDSPHDQEWIRFKLGTMTQALQRLGSRIRKRSPSVAVGADLFKDVGAPSEVLYGLSPAEHLPLLDVARVISEVHAAHAHADAEKEPNEKRAKSKKQRHSDEATPSLFGEAPAEAPRALRLETASEAAPAQTELSLPLMGAELSARCFGVAVERASFSGIGQTRWIQSPSSIGGSAQYGAPFFVKHREMFAKTQPLAAIALLQDGSSLVYGAASVREMQVRVQQALLEQRAAFDLLFDTQFAWLANYRCLIVAGCECLSDPAIEALARFTEAGGEVLALGPAGVRDPWRRERPSPALRAGERVTLLPVSALDELLSRVRTHQLWHLETSSRQITTAAYRTGERTILLIGNGGETINETRGWMKLDLSPREAALHTESERIDLAFSYDNGSAHFTLPSMGKIAMVEFS